MRLKLLAILTLLFVADIARSQTTLFPVATGKHFGYMNTSAKMAIPAQYEAAGVFTSGIALVKMPGENGSWGYIDTAGNFLIEPSYKYATGFNEGLAFNSNGDGLFYAIDMKGKLQFTIEATGIYNFSNGLAAFTVEDSYGTKTFGFIDREGKQVIAPRFYNVSMFTEGLCAVMNKEQKWGYIDRTGKLVIDYKFKDAICFRDGLASVHTDYWGVINPRGEYIIKPEYWQTITDGDKILIKLDGKWGWTDRTGKMMIKPQFDGICRFAGNKYAPVMVKDAWGFIDEKGTFLVEPQFATYIFRWDGTHAFGFKGSLNIIDQDGTMTTGPYVLRVSPDYQPDNFFDGAGRYYGAIADPSAEEAAATFLNAFANADLATTKTYLDGDNIRMLDMLTPMFEQTSKNRPTKRRTIIIDKVDALFNIATITYHTGEPQTYNYVILMKEGGRWVVVTPLTEIRLEN